MNPVAVMFDFDGVIVDSFAIHSSAWISAFEEEYKCAFPKINSKLLTGKSSLEIAQSICDHAGITLDITLFLKRKTAKIISGDIVPQLLPGVQETVLLLRELKIPFAVASNAPRAYLKMVLAYYDISIDVVLGFEQVENPKPAPDLFIAAAKQLGMSSSEFKNIVVFEDSVPGISAAKSAGMIPVGIRGQYNDLSMVTAGATTLYDSLVDVPIEVFVSTKNGG